LCRGGGEGLLTPKWPITARDVAFSEGLNEFPRASR
jgi:hypothetical protein